MSAEASISPSDFTPAAVAAILQNPVRMRIIALLASAQTFNVTTLAKACGVTPTATSKLLIQMEDSGFVTRGLNRIPRLSTRLRLNADRTELDLGCVIVRLSRFLD